MCSRCLRPVVVCYCANLPTLPTTTRVVILQHPRERDVAIGTARMASLALPNAELHVGVRWGESAALAAALSDPARPPILLYPGEGAKDILTEPPAGPVTLVVVDGTWSQARTVVRDNPVLKALPRYAFVAPEPSHYRIRAEPSEEFVSTIEALMHVLGVLEGDPARFRALLDPFHAMIDAQIACQARSPRARVRHERAKVPLRDRLPHAISERFEDLVCVVGEANAWPYSSGLENPRDELVHWVALRLATGELFDMIAAPERPLSPSTTFHSELAEDTLHAGHPRHEVLDGFARWVRPTDVICAWGHYGTSLFVDSGGTLPERLDLRAAAYKFHNQKLGSLEEFAGEVTPLTRGRGGRRLAMLAQIIQRWRAMLAP